MKARPLALIIFILIWMAFITSSAAALDLTYQIDTAHAKNLTIIDNTYIVPVGAETVTFPVIVTTGTSCLYAYYVTASIYQYDPQIILTDNAGWIEYDANGKLSSSIGSGYNDYITGTDIPLFDLTFNTSGLRTDTQYTLQLTIAGAAASTSSLSSPSSLQLITETKNIGFNITSVRPPINKNSTAPIFEILLIEITGMTGGPISVTITDQNPEPITGYNIFKQVDIPLNNATARGYINFTLTNSEIEAVTGGNFPENIRLMHKIAETWTEIVPTYVVNATAPGYDFSAYTDSFSPFAIAGIPTSNGDPGPVTTSTPIPTPTLTPNPTPTPTETSTPIPTPTLTITPTSTPTEIPTVTPTESPVADLAPSVEPGNFPGSTETNIESISMGFVNTDTLPSASHDSDVPVAVPIAADVIAVAAVISASGRNAIIAGSIIKDIISGAANIGTGLNDIISGILDGFGDAGDGLDSGNSNSDGQFGDETTGNMEVISAITATAGAGGKIEPFGLIEKELNTDIAFTVTPDAGYQIDDVIVDAKSIGAVSNFTINSGKENHKILVTFTRGED
jgi:hypothetical protein